MAEMNIGILSSLSLVCLAVTCFFYMWGGRSQKWIRRFVASLIASSTVNALVFVFQHWSPWLLLLYPWLSIGFHFGYGADIVAAKIVKRSIYASAVCSSGLLCCLVLGGHTWLVLPLHVVVGAWSIWLGVLNPLVAAAEEVFVCAVLLLGLMMYPFVNTVVM